MVLKPYHAVPIQDCGEALVSIPQDFARVDPHPYAVLGAPYGDRSPFYVRTDILRRLHQAQARLEQNGLRLQIFDAYRPIAVQQFMVDYTFEQERQRQGLGTELTEAEAAQLWTQVHTFWALPSYDPATPPPHSTGAAVDVTLIHEAGQVVEMGSLIDELSERSYPSYFEQNLTLPGASQFHQNREYLREAMGSAGFAQHPNEWWHFSYGDQMWGWLSQGLSQGLSQDLSQKSRSEQEAYVKSRSLGSGGAIAHYGAV